MHFVHSLVRFPVKFENGMEVPLISIKKYVVEIKLANYCEPICFKVTPKLPFTKSLQ